MLKNPSRASLHAMWQQGWLSFKWMCISQTWPAAIAISLFLHILDKKSSPTFVGIPIACGRAALVYAGMRFVSSMDEFCGVTPTLEHYACVLDLLGRSGSIQESWGVYSRQCQLNQMTLFGRLLLSPSWFWIDMETGERVSQHMFHLDPKPQSAYVILSNTFMQFWEIGEEDEYEK